MTIVSGDEIGIRDVAKWLKHGGVAAFATETVYGLGAVATQDAAVEKIFSLKGRPSHNPLIVHVADIVMARGLVEWNEAAEQLAAAYWPGALTLVLPRRQGCRVSEYVSSGGRTLALRMPAHAEARALIATVGEPIAAPSANRSGRVSPTRAAHVEEEFGSDLLVLDGGACQIGLESTVVDVSNTHPHILRPGSITQEMLEDILGVPVHALQSGKINLGQPLASPGMLPSHYAPERPVRLNATSVTSTEALLAWGEPIAGAAWVYSLSQTCQLEEAAMHLFEALRQADKSYFSAIAVMPIPYVGIGVAINDRLQRAAALKE